MPVPGPPPPPRRRSDAPAWGLADLRGAIAGERAAGALVVRYQPVVRTADGAGLGVEALVRWQRPDGSFVMPDAFISVAEAHGLGGHLDEVVLRQALAQLRRWDSAGVRVHRVGVNLGRTSVLRDDLVDVVARTCAETGCSVDRLLLEVLEHDPLDLAPDVLERLQALADAGATLSLDDFGSGCTGVGLLAQLPVGIVKLDRGLMPGSPRARARTAPAPEALLAGAVALARAVGAEVTAEGIETEEQRALCASLGVGHLQGWLFSPAVDADAVTAYFSAHPDTAPLPASESRAALTASA